MRHDKALPKFSANLFDMISLLVVRYAVFSKETLSFGCRRLLEINAHVFALERNMQFAVRAQGIKETGQLLVVFIHDNRFALGHFHRSIHRDFLTTAERKALLIFR